MADVGPTNLKFTCFLRKNKILKISNTIAGIGTKELAKVIDNNL